MSTLWHKIWYDLWHYKVRTLLTVMSITAGVFAIGVVFGMTDQLLAGMDAAHQAVTPSHINMALAGFATRDEIEGIRRVPGVVDVEPYTYLALEYRFSPTDPWKLGVATLRDDWERQHMDIVQLREGEWPRRENIAVERLSASYYNSGIGDTVSVKQNDRIYNFTVTGKIRHPFVPPPQFGGQAFFFFSPDALTHLGVPKGKFNYVFVRIENWSQENARAAATAIKDRLANQGIGVAATLYQDPHKHWGRVYMEGINIVLQVLAVVSLLLSVVLVYNTLTALIAHQTNQIGVLKAIGGRTRTIAQIYFANVLIYGLLALCIALPLGVYLSWAITRSFLNLFNIDYDTFHVSTTALVLQIGAALLVPLLAALVPVMNGARITVREAIASYGLGGDFGSNWLDRVIERIGAKLLPTQYATALGNMFRRKGRLLLTQLVLVMAGTMFLIVMTLSASMDNTVENFFASRRYDVTAYLNGRLRATRALELATSVQGVAAAQVQLWFPATVRKLGQRTQEAGLGTNVAGFDPRGDFFSERVVEGRWLQPGDDLAVVVSYDTANKNNFRVGDVITLDLGVFGKRDWHIVGLYQPLLAGAFSGDVIYAPLEALENATKQYDRATRIILRTTIHDEPASIAARDRLRDLAAEQNISIAAFQTEAEMRRGVESSFGLITLMLMALAILVAIVGGIALMGALSISVVERTKEIGVLRAIGARTRTLLAMFVMEGVLQGLLSWTAAILLSLALARPLSDLLGRTILNMPLDYAYNVRAVAIWLGIILFISVLASILPARNATRVSVRDSLAYA
jgi:putative ABC transport system permease protein